MPTASRARILFVSYTAEWTGPTASLLLLVRRLKERYEVCVLTKGSGPLTKRLELEGIRHWSMTALDKWSIPRIARLIRRNEIDLVYASNTHGSSRNAFLAAAITGRPFVCHVRGMLWHWSLLRGIYLRWAKAVIAVSHASAASVERFVRNGALHVVYNGVPEPPSGGAKGTKRDQLRNELGIRDTVCLVVSVAHLMPRKGQIHAVEALAHAADLAPGVHLAFIGREDRDHDYVAALRRRATELGLGSRVHFLGFRRDVPELLFDADVFLHTAVADPHPRAVLEAMASGLPVVAFGGDGVAETVVDGETGILTTPQNDEELGRAIAHLVNDPETRDRMGQAGRERVREEFTERRTAERVDRILGAVLNQRSRTPQ